jgi:hypothetical protein
MKIVIEVIPHSEQRYPTVGDWQAVGREDWLIQVSELGNWRMEMLVAIHELIEMTLCAHEGITSAEVDQFDLAFTRTDEALIGKEPGDDWRAPYYFQHQIATGIERQLAALMDVDWQAYENKVNSL